MDKSETLEEYKNMVYKNKIREYYYKLEQNRNRFLSGDKTQAKRGKITLTREMIYCANKYEFNVTEFIFDCENYKSLKKLEKLKNKPCN